MWGKWFAPQVRMYDEKLPQAPPSDQWCMILFRASYSSNNDAILNPMNLNKQQYVVLYGGWDYKPGATEPDGAWFDGVTSTPPDTTSRISGMLRGTGVGLFADKYVTRVNSTHQKVHWILPPSGPRHISWSTTVWLEPKNPYNDVDQNYYLLKREGGTKDKDEDTKNLDTIPPVSNPPKINFGGKPRQPQPYKPPTPPPLVFRRPK
jgi:hypothetical protein